MGAPRSHAELFRSLAALVPEKSEAVAHALRLPPTRLPPVTAGANERAAVVLRWAEKQPDGLSALARAIDDARGVAATGKKTGFMGRLFSLPARFIDAARTRSFRKRYFDQVLAERGFLAAPGLGHGGIAAAHFDALYVEPLLLAPTATTATTTPGSSTLEACLADLPAGTPLCIAGPPGAGKSTVLFRLALDVARGRLQSPALARARIPLFIDLAEHAERIAAGTVSIATLAQGHYGDAARFPSLRPTAGWFETQLEGGHCLVLLDGYDEIAAPVDRARVAAWVDRQVARHTGCRFVVASVVPVADPGHAVPFAGARVAALLGWDGPQIRRYTESWYRATSLSAARGKPRKGDPLPVDARFAEKEFLERLEASPRVQALARSPLQLALLIMLHRRNGLVPDERVELYAGACDALVDWPPAEADSLQREQKRTVLQALARAMMERRRGDLSAAEAAEILAPAMAAAGVRGVAPRALLEQLSRGSGLIVPMGPVGPVEPAGTVGPGSRWRFAHRIFQEYLCAADWESHAEPRLPSGWQSLAGDPWWHETLRLHAAGRDAAAIVSACLEVRSAPSLSLAVLCAGEVVSLPALLRRSAFEALDAEVASPDPELRRLAADTRFSRRLRSLYRTSATQEIDLEEVTGAEYQLFLSDLGAGALRHAPDHWMGASLPLSYADSPLLGVRREDALAFCDWLSRRSPGARYRLPSVAEVLEYPGGRADVIAWCGPGSPAGLAGSTGAAVAAATLPAALSEELADECLGALDLSARDDQLPPPAADILRRDLPREVAQAQTAMQHPLGSLAAACARAVEERAARSDRADRAGAADGAEVGPTVAVRELRRAAPPEVATRAAVLEYLALVHRALGTDHDELSPAHYQALRRSVHLDYPLVLDVVLATMLACELPLFLEAALHRTPFSADPALLLTMLRALGFYGRDARAFVEKRRYAEASDELAYQLSRGVPSKDPGMHRLASLAAFRLAVSAADSPDATLRAFWRYGARLASLAHEFADRASRGRGNGGADRSDAATGSILGTSAARKYREWADGPLLDLYWWIQLTLARADDRIIAWEGIRIVRETSPAQ